MSSISPIARIGILSKLILKYCDNLSFIESVKLAKDLANVIDDLRKHNVNLEKLMTEFSIFFPEHWEKRTKFLLIITKYWPEILNELCEEDVKLNDDFSYNYKCVSRNLSNNLDIKTVKNKINLFEAQDVFEEIDYIVGVIKSNPKKNIAVISPDLAFSEVLYVRLDLEKIEFSSSFEDYDREKIQNFLKKFEYIDEDISIFLDNISKSFGYFEEISKKNFRKLVILMLDFFHQEHDKKFVSIIKISDIKYCCSDVIISTSMNEEQWKFEDGGEYWLHESFKQKLGLSLASDVKKIINDDFYSIFNGFSEIFLTRSIKLNGTNALKSSVLTKLELLCKKNNIVLNYQKFKEDFSGNNIKYALDETKIAMALPCELSAKNIEFLMNDFEGFYAREILHLEPLIQDSKRLNLAIFFKNLMHSYFKGDSTVEDWLNLIKSADFFNYQKCRAVIEWLDRKPKGNKTAFNNIKGEAIFNINNFNLKVFSYADRIERNDDHQTLIVYKLSSPESTKDIIYSNGHSVMTTCLLAKKGGFPGVTNAIDEIQFWSLAGQGDEPISIKTLEINNELIDNFEERLLNMLGKCCSNQGQTHLNFDSKSNKNYNQYKHFERKSK